MTREEIKQWFDDRNKVGDSFRLGTEEVSIDALVALTNHAATEEREACAKFVREYGAGEDKYGPYRLLQNGVLADAMLHERTNKGETK